MQAYDEKNGGVLLAPADHTLFFLSTRKRLVAMPVIWIPSL